MKVNADTSIIPESVRCQLETYYRGDTIRMDWFEVVAIRELVRTRFKFSEPQIERRDNTIRRVSYENGLWSEGDTRVIIESCRFRRDMLYLEARDTTETLKQIRTAIHRLIAEELRFNPDRFDTGISFANYATDCSVRLMFSLDDLLCQPFKDFLQDYYKNVASYDRPADQFHLEVATVALGAALEARAVKSLPDEDTRSREDTKVMTIAYGSREERVKGIARVSSELAYREHVEMLRQLTQRLSSK